MKLKKKNIKVSLIKLWYLFIVQEINSLQKFVKDNGEFQQFKTGQLISDRDKDSTDLYLIIEGEARLIF